MDQAVTRESHSKESRVFGYYGRAGTTGSRESQRAVKVGAVGFLPFARPDASHRSGANERQPEGEHASKAGASMATGVVGSHSLRHWPPSVGTHRVIRAWASNLHLQTLRSLHHGELVIRHEQTAAAQSQTRTAATPMVAYRVGDSHGRLQGIAQ